MFNGSTAWRRRLEANTSDRHKANHLSGNHRAASMTNSREKLLLNVQLFETPATQRCFQHRNILWSAAKQVCLASVHQKLSQTQRNITNYTHNIADYSDNVKQSYLIKWDTIKGNLGKIIFAVLLCGFRSLLWPAADGRLITAAEFNGITCMMVNYRHSVCSWTY